MLYLPLFLVFWELLRRFFDGSCLCYKNPKRDKIISNFVSATHTAVCNGIFILWLLNWADVNIFIFSMSYFVYDLWFQVRYYKDKIMIIHHLISMASLGYVTPSHPDYESVRWALHFLEFSNIFVHPTYLLHAMNIKSPTIKILGSYILTNLEFLFFLLFRCFIPTFYIYPFKDPILFVTAIISHVGGIYWTHKIYLQLQKIND